MPFCKYCGTQLEEGQICACPQAQAAAQPAAAQQQVPQQQQVQQQAPQQQWQPQQQWSQQPGAQPGQAQQAAAQQWANAQATAVKAAKTVKPYLSEYFPDPARALSSVAEQDNLTLAVVLTIVRVLAMFLAIYGLLHKICKSAMSMLAISGGSSVIGMGISAPLISSFIYGALIAVAGMALFIGVVFAIVKIQHGTASIKAVFEVSAANGVLTSVLLLVAFAASFVSIEGCILFILLACISWVVCGVLSAQVLCPSNSFGSFWLVYFIGVLLIYFVGFKIIPSLFAGAVGDIAISYGNMSTTIKSMLEASAADLSDIMGDMGSLSDLFNEMLGDLLRYIR